MSHFVVLVIGDNVDDQLAKYQEWGLNTFKTTPLKSLLVSEGFNPAPENMMVYLNSLLQENSRLAIVESDFGEDTHSLRQLLDADFDRFITVDKDGTWLAVHQIYTEGAKWDWYMIGGRWKDMLKAKPGATGERDRTMENFRLSLPWNTDEENQEARREGYYDILKVEDLDIDGMEENPDVNQIALYDKFHEVLAGREVPDWNKLLETREAEGKDVHEIREEFWNHPVMKDITGHRLSWGWERYLVTRDEYIQHTRVSSWLPFAYLKDGEWFERGQMGWFGQAVNEEPYMEWYDKVRTMLASLPPGTKLTVVDCHI